MIHFVVALVLLGAGAEAASARPCGDDQHELNQGNVIAIEHDDRTYAKYGHITRDGALVEVGEAVVRGQVIALSGNSGASRTPHVHFSVKACPEGSVVGGRDCYVIPITFRNTTPHPHGLIGSPTSEIGGGTWYSALEWE